MTTPLQRARFGFSFAAFALLAGCVDSYATRADQAPIGPLERPAVIDPKDGSCHARATTPALIETVTEQVMVQPADVLSDGTVQSPAVFRTVTRQRILRERREVEFEIPCANIQTPEFIASVQRALVARGYYTGPVSGVMDARTARAVGRFQTANDDVQTQQITLKTARRLGLVALPRETL